MRNVTNTIIRWCLGPFAIIWISVGCRTASDSQIGLDGPNSGETSSTGDRRDGAVPEMTWEDVLEKMSLGAKGEYSYVPFYPQQEGQAVGGIAYGTTLRIGLADRHGACPSIEDAETTPGWWFHIITNGLGAGEYSYEWIRESAVHQTEVPWFNVKLGWRGPDDSAKRYQVLSGTLKLDTSVVELADATEAGLISGRLVLTVPTPSIWEVGCRAAFSQDAGVVNLGCDCLVDDEELKSCIPASPDEICCAELTTDTVEWDIPFEVRPCASLCTSADYGAYGLCTDLQERNLDNW